MKELSRDAVIDILRKSEIPEEKIDNVLGTLRISLARQAAKTAEKSILFDRRTLSDLEESLRIGGKKMRIAVPLAQGKLSLHFGHCDQFAIFDIDDSAKKVINRKDATAPAHEPGVLPRWLHDNNVAVIIAGGMGQRAQQLFAQNDIRVIVGASSGTPEELVLAYLDDTLETGDNICDH